MKKSLVALAVFGTLAGTAAAQSSVTAFGVIDLGVRQVKGAIGNQSLLAADGSSSSRLGFRGVEDLGGGLKAGFWLEAPLAGDTGAANATRFWDRRATVSLMGDFGEVRMGRHKTSHRLVIDDFDPFSTTGPGAITAIFSGLGSASGVPNRVDNQVHYILPSSMGGFYGSADVAAGEGADGNKTIAGRLGYKAGPLHAAVGYGAGGAASKYKLTVGAAAYNFGVVNASLMVAQSKFQNRKQSIWNVGATVPVGSGALLASYGDSNANNAAEALSGTGDAKLFVVGYNYNLSKRTALYSLVSQISNSGLGRFVVAGAPAAANGGKSRAIGVGVKHSF